MNSKTKYDLSTFSKEGKIEDVKVGTKVWFKSFSETDVGVVTKTEYRNYDGEYVAWVKWTDGDTAYVNYSGFNDGWGIIVEKEQGEIQQEQEQNQHKYYNVIVHWASGGKIQYKVIGPIDVWSDFTSTCAAPNFDSNIVLWRIKPETKTIRYRTALLVNNEITVFTSEDTLEDTYEILRWLDPDWKEVEVEI